MVASGDPSSAHPTFPIRRRCGGPPLHGPAHPAQGGPSTWSSSRAHLRCSNSAEVAQGGRPTVSSTSAGGVSTAGGDGPGAHLRPSARTAHPCSAGHPPPTLTQLPAPASLSLGPLGRSAQLRWLALTGYSAPVSGTRHAAAQETLMPFTRSSAGLVESSGAQNA